ncbi:hypothetical protein VNO78_22136 [Psophocarpus tetragonolobus]|uniref:Uncharacterized protein n=1 Tax=Psophocarpus tetragonolobus TaxID=3891 RepID=A0AAN9XIX1_PSOTE
MSRDEGVAGNSKIRSKPRRQWSYTTLLREHALFMLVFWWVPHGSEVHCDGEWLVGNWQVGFASTVRGKWLTLTLQR